MTWVACYQSVRALLAIVVFGSMLGCQSSGDLLANLDPPQAGGDLAAPYLVVDCLLPPQIVRQGEASVRFMSSRAVKTSAYVCARRGGAQKGGLDLWQAVAESGNADAQNYLGEMYESGTGGAQQDIHQALVWYARAADAGNPKAMTNLAHLYDKGAPGLPRDAQKAKMYFVQSMAKTGVDTRQIDVVPINLVRRQPIADNGQGGDFTGFEFGAYHALLIGNGDYRNLPKLQSPTNEVDVIGRLLETHYGFRVTKLKNATRDRIFKALDDMGDRLGPTDNLLIYYSGHGAESATKEGYWIPVDGEAPTSRNQYRTRLWVSSSEVREKLSVLPARHVLLVSDSCYAARFVQFRGQIKPGANLTNSRYFLENFGKLYGARSRTALTSGGNSPVIEPNDGSNMSLFAKAFLQFLDQNRVPVASVNIFSAIALDVINESSRLGFAQEPQWGPIAGGGHESGDFWFKPR